MTDRTAPARVPPLAALAHELRTPLHGVLGVAGVLRTTALDAEQRAHVAALEEAAGAMLRLVDDALDLARLDDGGPALDPAPCDLREVVAGVARAVAPLAAAKGLAVACDVDADVPARVVVDAGRLRQLLLNLAGNAVKYTARGSVRLHARRAPHEGDDAVAIGVADTGPGLSEAHRARLFRSWERLGADDGGLGGAGIGLVLAAALAARMGGRIDVASAYGAGSTFTLLAPLPPAPPDAPR